MARTCLRIAAAVCLCASAAGGREVTLATGGKAAATIVTPKDPPAWLRPCRKAAD